MNGGLNRLVTFEEFASMELLGLMFQMALNDKEERCHRERLLAALARTAKQRRNYSGIIPTGGSRARHGG